MRKYLTIWIHSVKISAQRTIEYRTDFFLWALVSFGWTIFSLLFYQILFLQTTTVAGWNKEQMFAFVGTFMIIDSATWGLFWRNIQVYTEAIFSGSMDFLLLQPIDAQFRLSTRHIGFTNLPRTIIGIILVARHVPQQSLTSIVFYILIILLSLCIIYLLWFFTATFTFWVEKLDNVVEIVPTLRRIWSVPAEVYSGPVSAILTIVVPLALISTTPTRVLFHHYQWNEIITLLVFTIIFFMMTRKFFFLSIKKYSGVGS